jgi:steroid delta-isomerase-like uncharacterized protein
MSIETNKDVVRSFVQRVLQDLDTNAVDELVADDFESHGWPAHGSPKESLKATAERLRGSLSDISFKVDDLIAEEDMVVARLTASARQTGEFMGLPPSGRSYEIGEIHIFRVRDGQIVEHWYEMDAMGLMSQLKGD